MDLTLEIQLNYPFEYNANETNKYGHASDAHPALLDKEEMPCRIYTWLTKHFRMGLLKQVDKEYT